MSILDFLFGRRNKCDKPSDVAIEATTDAKQEDAGMTYLEKADLYEERGQIDMAINAYRESISCSMLPAMAHRALILLLIKDGRDEDAIVEIDKYISDYPDYSPERALFQYKKERLAMKIDGKLREYTEYHNVNITEFLSKYERYMSLDLAFDMQDKKLRGRKTYRMNNDDIDELEVVCRAQEQFDRLLSAATSLNNQGMDAEKVGDIDGAIKLYEQNILPGTYFTIHPYRRLCILYRKAGDYDNEIRIIKTCLARGEWKEKRYAESKEHIFFKDRLVKAEKYRE